MYVENGFVCQIGLRNTGPYEHSYGPVPLNWTGYDLFVSEINFAAMLFFAYPSDIAIIILKFLLKWAAKICGPLKRATA